MRELRSSPVPASAGAVGIVRKNPWFFLPPTSEANSDSCTARSPNCLAQRDDSPFGWQGVKKARLSTRSIREASREDHFGEVDGHFVLRGHCREHRVMGRFPQAIALLLAYASAAIATSPYSLPAAQLLGCPPSPACKGPRRPHWSNECSRRKRSCR